MSTGTGTQQDPIIAMSADPAQIARDIRASLAHFNRTDDAYWLEKESAPAKFSNELWHLGHNRYWETAMAPTDTGSRNPADGRLPALFWATVTVQVPLPDPPSAPPDETAAGVLALVLARLESIDARLTKLDERPTPTLPTFPTYSATVHAPWPIGTQTIALTPVVPK